MAFNLPLPLSTFRSLTSSPPPEKGRHLHATKGNLQIPYLSLFSLSRSLPALSYPCQLLFHFNEYLPGNGLISVAKYLFLSGVDLVCLKPTARTDRLSARRSSEATMLSVGSWNTDEWRDRAGGGGGGGEEKVWVRMRRGEWMKWREERKKEHEWNDEEGGGWTFFEELRWRAGVSYELRVVSASSFTSAFYFVLSP